MDITLHQGWSATIHLSDKPFVIEGQVRGSGLQCCPRPGGAGPTQGRCGAQVCSVVPGQGGPARPRAGAGLWSAVLSQARGGRPDPEGSGLQCYPRPGGAVLDIETCLFFKHVLWTFLAVDLLKCYVRLRVPP